MGRVHFSQDFAILEAIFVFVVFLKIYEIQKMGQVPFLEKIDILATCIQGSKAMYVFVDESGANKGSGAERK